MRPLTLLALLVGLAATLAGAAREEGLVPIDRPPEALRPGEYAWAPALAPEGPMVIVVSLPEQRAYVYRNGIRIGVSTVSTGKAGHETPTGVFGILQKRRMHYSNLYDDAPMPFMQRLTWDGIALHAGQLPGYPASHGCVRLPHGFSRLLFEATAHGMTVVIASDASHPPEVVSPGLFAPVEAATGAVRESGLALGEGGYEWVPERAPEGAVTVVVSGADRRVVVLRNGVEIGRARVDVAGADPLGTRAFVRLEDEGESEGRGRWMRVDLPGYADGEGAAPEADLGGRLAVAPGFAEAVRALLAPGATVVITDAPIRPRTTGAELTVLRADDEPEPAWDRDE